MIKVQLILEQRPQREVPCALRPGQRGVEVGQRALLHERLDDEARVADLLLAVAVAVAAAAAAAEFHVRHLALGRRPRRAHVHGVLDAREAQARLELDDEGRPDEAARVLPAAEEGEGGFVVGICGCRHD